MKPSLLLIGLGDLGHVILELLVREKALGQIIACDINEERGVARCHLAQMSAIAHRFSPSLRFLPLDVNQKQAVVKAVKTAKPDIILNTASLQSWCLPDLLPFEQSALIKSAGFGMWFPVHFALTLKLMEVLQEVDYQGVTLSAPFPDVVNPVLGCLDMAPTCGVGNLDEIVPKIKWLTSRKINATVDEIDVLLVAHHALEGNVYGEPHSEHPPFFLRIEYKGKDITKQVRADELLFAPFPLPPGRAIHFLTAGSTLRLIQALLGKEEQLLHVPGPDGLPGGYPVLVSKGKVEVAALKGITLKEAVRINELSHRFDGIERIEADGTVVFCSDNVEIFKEELGYDCTRLHPQDALARAEELISRFREYARKYGLHF